VKINPNEIVIDHLKGSGPGGQHRNKRETGIRITHIPTGLVVMATEERHQSINLERAMERLRVKLEKFYFKPKKRWKTLVPKSSKQNRLKKKKIRSEKKFFRKSVSLED
jgi:protein subunit release factor A